MKLKNRLAALLVASASLAAVSSGNAANTFYAPGDLVLFFQKPGNSNTIYANLGNAANLYRGASAGIGLTDGTLTSYNIIDLNSTLTSAYGAGWASDASIYAGLAGVWGTSATNGTLTDGDPHRTLYVSLGRGSASTPSAGWNLFSAGNTAMTGGATNITAMLNTFENNYDAQIAISPTGTSTIDDQNPFTSPGVQGPAFNTFAGGVQQAGSASNYGNYGSAGDAEFALDLYRILARNNVTGQVAGDLRVGSLEGTVIVGTNGQVSFVVPEPSSTVMIGLAAGALVLRRRRTV
jgi:hypothetical protein